MKLLIDIPEHIYEHAKEESEDSRDEGEAMRAIANGTQQESRSEIPNTCGDAVSRAIVQEEITKSIELKENPYQLWYRIQALPSVTPQQRTGRWIPVSERVPEDGEEVLCFLGSEEMAVLFRRNDWGQDERVDGGFATGSYDVVAWMPLPLPFRAESEVDS